MWTPLILLGFGIPIFAHVIQFWGKALRATVIFIIKGATNARPARPAAPAARPARVWVAGSNQTEILPSSRGDQQVS